ncbi:MULTISPECIES: beta-ketoacyl-ACP synthase III [unclassified Streptomyces]|uniref:Beta-ketoacyl-[acyl-carrier-protein] synthase III n=1 Tax=Streptomyces evansiae TaxID=3075535 RepID=A0ABD5E1Q0_9ACTN|nr:MULTISPECIES: beta-ketoacyl-ACP synthase III [unclassified Streptomyces]EGJ75292.1 putative 3-oxoacyl-(acyl-carrier-protein) synthase III [Streptomyces sp. Tu6071]MDT0407607.1 beta-ketoacyl-ACP synthase III [Streptomyces sp. DSM 41979]MDT0415375.1 beta-ketoacyl-ACP synthase III [Streptomyces sp. DSM 41982]MYQ61107.1 beta-ketoacyl-ACP synthase III [Streptomyces sp. SID4926]MYR28872.1 beta-ketoacyl-ACP synthase III [Streptomyces sp. SID4945]
MTGTRITALGHYQPSRVLTNQDLAELVDTNDAWIRSRVGIRTRHLAAEDETVDSMAAAAAEKALAHAGTDPADIDLVLVATCTAEDRAPSMAARTAARLGIPHPAAMDVNAACSGFSHALALADQALRTGSATRALVIGSEKFSSVADWTDRSSCILVGDGAAAAVVEPAAEPGISPVVWGSFPDRGPAVRIEGTPPRFAQEGQAVFRWATTELPALVRKVCDRAGVLPSELGAVVLHQANLRIIEPLAAKLGASGAVVATDVIDSGNTSAASVPLAFSKLLDQGRVPAGAPALLFGFGGGLSYAGQIVTAP